MRWRRWVLRCFVARGYREADEAGTPYKMYRNRLTAFPTVGLSLTQPVLLPFSAACSQAYPLTCACTRARSPLRPSCPHSFSALFPVCVLVRSSSCPALVGSSARLYLSFSNSVLHTALFAPAYPRVCLPFRPLAPAFVLRSLPCSRPCPLFFFRPPPKHKIPDRISRSGISEKPITHYAAE